jgi:colicin import membrane protein
MRRILVILMLAVAVIFSHGIVSAQKKENDKVEKKAVAKEKKVEAKDKKSDATEKAGKSKTKEVAPAKSEDPVVGKTKDGKAVYEGARGGFYYLTEGGTRSYVKDFVGAKIVGKTTDGLPIYEGPRGGRFYYNSSGEKMYVKK